MELRTLCEPLFPVFPPAPSNAGGFVFVTAHLTLQASDRISEGL